MSVHYPVSRRGFVLSCPESAARSALNPPLNPNDAKAGRYEPSAGCDQFPAARIEAWTKRIFTNREFC
jgi:hypothetical protein